MNIITTLNDLLKIRETLKDNLGLVPTMGNLHQGHLSLLEKSLQENENTILTIFVNPKQFGKGEDFSSYPRTLTNDLKQCEYLHKKFPQRNLIIFAPEHDKEIYGETFETMIQVNSYQNILCDKFRPGHFTGVTTVVYRIFSITKPNTAYFGQKDFQQFKLIEKMTHDLRLPIELRMEPIIRDQNGLALSSRNQYLTEDELKSALELPGQLMEVEHILKNQSLESAQNFSQELVKKNSSWQYLEILERKNLEAPNLNTQNFVIAGAFLLNNTRLIDNRLVTI